MFDFKPEIKETGTVAAEKTARIQNGFLDVLNEEINTNKLINEAYQMEKDCIVEENINKLNAFKESANYIEKQEQLTDEAIVNENFNILMEDFFFKLFENSLIFDKKSRIITNDFKKELKLKSNGLTKEFYGKSKLHINTIKSVEDSAEYLAEQMYENILEEDELRNKFINIHSKLIEDISGIIRNKVEKVINEEKIAVNVNNMKEEDLTAIPMSESYFTKIQLENAKMYLEASKQSELTENLKTEIMCESIIDYTFLEMFNTLKLLNC